MIKLVEWNSILVKVDSVEEWEELIHSKYSICLWEVEEVVPNNKNKVILEDFQDLVDSNLEDLKVDFLVDSHLNFPRCEKINKELIFQVYNN